MLDMVEKCGALALVDLLGVGVATGSSSTMDVFTAVSIAPSSGSKSLPLILESTCVPRQTKDSHPSGLV
ncbi:hypothetical protein MTR67_048724 [Solanum verrucosum]|uniref:Uncharacterized protein n=1 Tax=Solanum verrucosum TaxID=315347 RepID=A0AAF1A0D3_SOLVR|nr:hypothetical protein MTR67_048724 [Solanum verrucosum]